MLTVSPYFFRACEYASSLDRAIIQEVLLLLLVEKISLSPSLLLLPWFTEYAGMRWPHHNCLDTHQSLKKRKRNSFFLKYLSHLFSYLLSVYSFTFSYLFILSFYSLCTFYLFLHSTIYSFICLFIYLPTYLTIYLLNAIILPDVFEPVIPQLFVNTAVAWIDP